MESSVNSSSSSEASIMSAEEIKPKETTEEQNSEKEIMEADVANAFGRFRRFRSLAVVSNDNAFGSLQGRTQTLNLTMEALSDPNTYMMGLYCSNENAIKVIDTLLQRITRRAERDNMFDVILKATVTKKPDVKKIQDEIAACLGLRLDEKSRGKRASLLHDNMKKKQKILVILCELCEGIDLQEVGIPCGTDHTGCKILLTSTSEEILSNKMHTQMNFMV